MSKTVSILVPCIILLSVIASLSGLFNQADGDILEYRSVRGEMVELYGKGLYQYDSVSVAAQGKASDLVTLLLAVPLLTIAYTLARKGSLGGQLILTGTLGYFLYTYTSYTFLWMYNPLFIVYVALMSMSFFSFVASITSLKPEKLASAFKDTLPVKLLGGFQLFLGLMVGLMWLAKIAPTILNAGIPAGLAHYTTLTIQGLDLGFVVPVSILSGILLIKRNPMGYLLSSVVILKGVTMLTAITAMMINMAIVEASIDPVEIILFAVFNIFAIICSIILFKNIQSHKEETEAVL